MPQNFLPFWEPGGKVLPVYSWLVHTLATNSPWWPQSHLSELEIFNIILKIHFQSAWRILLGSHNKQTWFVCCWHFSPRYFMCIISFSPHNDSVMWVSVLTPIYRKETETSRSNLPWVTQPVSCRTKCEHRPNHFTILPIPLCPRSCWPVGQTCLGEKS